MESINTLLCRALFIPSCFDRDTNELSTDQVNICKDRLVFIKKGCINYSKQNIKHVYESFNYHCIGLDKDRDFKVHAYIDLDKPYVVYIPSRYLANKETVREIGDTDTDHGKFLPIYASTKDYDKYYAEYLEMLKEEEKHIVDLEEEDIEDEVSKEYDENIKDKFREEFKALLKKYNVSLEPEYDYDEEDYNVRVVYKGVNVDTVDGCSLNY